MSTSTRRRTVLLSCLVAVALTVPDAQAHHATVPDLRADATAAFATVQVNERDWGTGSHCIFSFVYTTYDGSARAGEDYQAVSGEGRMAHGRGSFRIPLLDDDRAEGGETVRIVVAVIDPSEYYVVGSLRGLRARRTSAVDADDHR